MSNFPLVELIIVLTVACSIVSFRNPAFRERYLFSTWGILGGHQYERLFTSALLHGGWLHLGVNMYVLWMFGKIIETLPAGGRIFLGIYLVSILGGSLLSLYLHRNHPGYRALGASGGTSGIVFAYIFLIPGGWLTMFIPIPVSMPAWVFAIAYLIFSMYGIRANADNIGHDAHLGGALGGLLMTIFIYPKVLVEQTALFLAVCVLVAAFIAFNRAVPEGYTMKESAGYLKSRWKKRQKVREEVSAEKEEVRMNQLLDRISADGIGSLSQREKDELSRLAARKKEREDAARRSPDRWRRQ